MKVKLQLALIALGLAIVAAGIYHRVPVIVALTLVGVGIFAVVSGVLMIVRRRAEIPLSDAIDAPREYHTGLTAQLWGALFVAGGVLLALLGAATWWSPERYAAWVERVLSTSSGRGLLAGAAGLAFGAYGLTRLLAGPHAFRESHHERPWERKIAGCYTLVIGAGLVVLSALMLFAPWVLRLVRDRVVAFVTRLATQ
jgi:hypothetical protein